MRHNPALPIAKQRREKELLLIITISCFGLTQIMFSAHCEDRGAAILLGVILKSFELL